MAPRNSLTLSALQFTAVDGEKADAFRKVSALLDVAGDRGSDLVVLPEIWTGLSYSGPEHHAEITAPKDRP